MRMGNRIRSSTAPRSRPAYTLIELLVVIGIIGILMAIAVAVGSNVVGSGKAKSTSDVIKTLETALASYSSGRAGKSPPPFVKHPEIATHTNEMIPIVDGFVRPSMGGGGDFMLDNSAALFVLQAKDVAAADTMIKGIPTRFMRDYTPKENEVPILPTPIDAWGNPIRYVHPALDGMLFDNPASATPSTSALRSVQSVLDDLPSGQVYTFTDVRRTCYISGGSASDIATLSDGGTCVADRPYFYSLGPDGKAGFEQRADGSVADYNADNIYVTRPTLPANPFR